MGSEIRFGSGETLRVGLELSQIQELLQRALRENALLELEAPGGRVVVINPQQIQMLQNDEGPPSS